MSQPQAPIKILFVIDSFAIGGAERSLCTLLNHLPPERFDIHVMVTARGGALEKYLPHNVRVSSIPVREKGFAAALAYRLRRLWFSLSLRVPRLRPAGHLSEHFWRVLGSLSAAPSESYDVAVAYQQGFSTFYVAEKVRANRKLAWINADLCKAGYSKAFNLPFYSIYNMVVTASPELKRIMSEAWGLDESKTQAITDIVDLKMLERMAGQTNPYAGSKPGRLNILSVGRLDPVKGFDMAIAAAAILHSRKIDFHWDIIGEGEMHGSLQNAIARLGLQGQVTLIGATDNPYPWMRHCDIYVQPSYSEGYGIAVCEAKMFRRPTVVTDFKVASGLIDNGRNGIITKMTPEAIAEAIIRLSDSELREHFSKQLSLDADNGVSKSLDAVINLLSYTD